MIAITGNTYPVKDQLKSLGAKWNPDQKVWMISPEKANEAAKIVAEAPKQSFSQFRPSRCKSCGCAPSRYNKIYRNGQCKDCFVSDKEEAEMGY